jgi:serine/threonine protein kinase
MDSLTEPVSAQPRSSAETLAALDWLDALASGACDAQAFRHGVDQLLEHSPDAGWELLALLDQYYRRGKIHVSTFTSLKMHLQALLMGQSGPGELSAPGAAPDPPTSASPAPAVGDAEPHAERLLNVGDVLRGRYRITALLGQGGMGTVFEAIDEYRLDGASGDQRVAIKVLHTAVIQRPRLFAELRREFQHLQSLSHPNIVRVHEFDRDGDLAFFTMEYLSGMLLTRVVAAHAAAPMHRPYACSIVRDVGAAVTHAHARGVVHGDLNPGNIFITDAGEVRVLDFGAAHQLRRTPWISDFEGTDQITVATPRFASCQLLEGETADARDDVYALACIAYMLLTGFHPFRDHSAQKARAQRMKPVRPAGIGRRQWHALRAGLAFERDRRPSDMQTWVRDLASGAAVAHLPELPRLLRVQAPRERNDRWLAPAASIALVAVGVWWVMTHTNATRPVEGNRLSAEAPPTVQAPASLKPPQDRPHAAAAAPVAAAVPPAVQKVVTAGAAAPVPPAPASSSSRAPSPSHAPAPAYPPAEGANPVQGANPIHARVELALDNVDVPPGDAVAHVIVRRSRTLRGDVSFNWWTESGTAKPGRDFTPVKPQVEHIADGRTSADLIVPVAVDPSRHDPRSFYIVIDEASENAALGARTLTMVTLPGTE